MKDLIDFINRHREILEISARANSYIANEGFHEALKTQNEIMRYIDNNSNLMSVVNSIEQNVIFQNLAINSLGYDFYDYSKLLDIENKFSVLPNMIKRNLMVLSHYGWFIDMDEPINFIKSLARALDNGNEKDVDIILCNHFKNKLDEISENINKNYPDRREIFKAAIGAHLNCDYNLSIPVILIQCDGVCKEKLNNYFFMRRNKVPQTAETATKFEENCDEKITSAYLEPLSKVTTINKSYNDGDVNFKGLNRHMIIHGVSTDYGTEINSYKAISLINYLSKMISIIS